ncbi:MAG TPA: glycosyltransferase family 39 protein [Vicinamibacteria bacterium]|nr:glycosyltransferase family 39 protein [Vicinamibacteria bacterium]
MLLRRHWAWLVLLAAASALRLYGLDWLPSPAGDEGNWSLYGQRILRGEPVALEANAAFVSLLYAHLIAASMRVVGSGFFAARLVGTLAILATLVMAYAVPARLGSRRAGLALAALVALHPWSVAYSRICSVPYALAFAVSLAGSLLFLAGLRTQRIASVATGVLVVSLGAHFSPLTAAAPVACGLFALARRHRWIWRRWPFYAAVALAALHALPVVRSALGVARQAPPLDPVQHFWPRLGSHLHMITTGLAGEATLRHFTNLALDPWPALLLAAPVLGVVVIASTAKVRAVSPLGGFGPFSLLVAMLLTPLILAPGREWDLPANHMDRYLFSVLPGFAMCVASLGSLRTRWATAGVLALTAWFAVCDGRLAWAFLVRGGVDHGETIYDGGSGYRGWLVSDRPQAVAYQIRDEVLRVVGPGGAAILVADRSFIPLTFVMEDTGIPVFDVRRTWIPPRRDGRYFVLLWPDRVLSVGHPPTAPRKYLESNRDLRERLQARFDRTRLVRAFRQPGGAPLLELWFAEKPRTPRLSVAPRGPGAATSAFE